MHRKCETAKMTSTYLKVRCSHSEHAYLLPDQQSAPQHFLALRQQSHCVCFHPATGKTLLICQTPSAQVEARYCLCFWQATAATDLEARHDLHSTTYASLLQTSTCPTYPQGTKVLPDRSGRTRISGSAQRPPDLAGLETPHPERHCQCYPSHTGLTH